MAATSFAGETKTGLGMKACLWPWLAALVILTMSHGVLAQPRLDPQPLQLDTQVFVERVTTDVNGRPRRLLAINQRAASGDQLIVIVHWRNAGDRPVRASAITRALPRGVNIDPSNPAMQLSVDDGAHWGRLDQLWLPTPLGGVRRAVPADIPHVRWTLPTTLEPGSAGRLSYRATMR